MKKLLSLLMAVFAVVLVSCSDTDDLRSSQPQSDRIYFADKNAFEAYLASPTSVELAFPSASASNDVVGQFKEYTDVGKLLNKDLEFQVGDTIYKYCASGNGVFEIEASKYEMLRSFYDKDAELIDNLSSLKEVSPYRYQVTEGLIFVYTGEPIIVVQNFVSPTPTRTSLDGLTQVQTSFWTSKGMTSSCGVRVKAWSRENTNQAFQDANTDMTLEWNIQIRADSGVAYRSSKGGLAGKGNMIKQKVTSDSGFVKYTLWTNSLILGRAKCWDGSWIEAKVAK